MHFHKNLFHTAFGILGCSIKINMDNDYSVIFILCVNDTFLYLKDCNKNDSLRKKPQTNGGPNFLLRDLHSSSNGGLADKIGNGHVSTGYGGHHPPPNGINQMGMTVNPFQHMHDQQQMQTTQFEGSDRNYSPEDMVLFYDFLRTNFQEIS